MCWLLASATPAEVATATDLHRAQANQLAEPGWALALAASYRDLEATWLRYGPPLLGPAATVDTVLPLAPPEVADRVAERLRAVGFAVPWPPPDAASGGRP